MVEDSDEEATILLNHLEHYGKVHGIRFITTRSVTAFELVNDAIQADLVFMDIDLPGINGMEAAEMLRESDTTTPLIFVTNLAQYAVRGYQVDALDFMVKPIAYGDFSMRMDRAMRAVKKNAGRTVAIPTAGGMRLVEIDDIIYVELSKHDLVFHLCGIQGGLRRRGSIKSLVDELPTDKFLLVSQGCIANMGHIATVRGDAVMLDDGTMLYFSRSRKRPGMETLARYLGGTI